MTPTRPQINLIIFICLLSNTSFANESDVSLANYRTIKKLHADLTGDGHDEEIIIGSKQSNNEKPTLLIVDDGRILMESPQALLPVGNAYSPASFDGFKVEIATSHRFETSTFDIQGENTEIFHSSTPGKKLVLITAEDGNTSYNFNLQYTYDQRLKGIYLQDIFLSINNTSCDQSLKSVYVIDKSAFSEKSLQKLNAPIAFQELKEIHQGLIHGKIQGIKLMPKYTSTSLDQALSAYKENNKQNFKQIMGTFIEGGGSYETCPAENYIAEKYYFPNNPRWSNDLGFLFEKSGYYNEAIELLREVINKQPKRVVAYLNLADSYWAAGNTKQASLTYEKYQSLMKDKGELSKVPERVKERIEIH